MRPVAILTRAGRRTLDLLLIALILAVLATIVVARVIPYVTGGATFVVGGGSMEPAIPFGSVVVVTPVPAEQLAVGDVVSVRVGAQQAVFTHRIVRLVPREDGLWLETKGDANDKPDPSIIPATTVIGRLEASLPYAGYAVRLLSTAQGVLFLLAFGVLLLAGAWTLESLELDQAAAGRRAARARVVLAPDSAPGSASNEGAAG
jgi:signal peptidase